MGVKYLYERPLIYFLAQIKLKSPINIKNLYDCLVSEKIRQRAPKSYGTSVRPQGQSFQKTLCLQFRMKTLLCYFFRETARISVLPFA